VLLEAMASGLPIISTTRTGAPDLIRQGKEGLIVEPGNVSELVGALEYFLSRPEETELMGHAARRRAEYFTWGRFRSRVGQVVGQILREPQLAGARNYV
jgi:glycosyltransferase involved in cell wall biosynthesis